MGSGELRSWCLMPAAGMEEGLAVARFPSGESGPWWWPGQALRSLIPCLGFQRLLPVTLQWMAPGLLAPEGWRLRAGACRGSGKVMWSAEVDSQPMDPTLGMGLGSTSLRGDAQAQGELQPWKEYE